MQIGSVNAYALETERQLDAHVRAPYDKWCCHFLHPCKTLLLALGFDRRELRNPTQCVTPSYHCTERGCAIKSTEMSDAGTLTQTQGLFGAVCALNIRKAAAGEMKLQRPIVC